MMNPSKIFGSALRVGLLIALASLAQAGLAHASPSYPVALATAVADLYKDDQTVAKCSLQCTACHNTLQGGPMNLNPFGTNMKADGLGGSGQIALVEPTLKKFEMADSATVKAALNNDCGAGADVPQYGCGARIAAPPPVDRLSLFGAGAVIFGVAALRRRRDTVRGRRTRK